MKITVWAMAFMGAVIWTSAASAQTKPFGANLDGWSFTATTEKPGMVNCRAIRKAGGREDTMALRSNWQGYFSVKAEGRKGKWPKSIVNAPGQPRGRLEFETTAEANGGRMWFPLDKGVLDELANRGGFEWSLGDTEDSGKVVFGPKGGQIWERVNQCVLKNGG